MPEQFEQSEQKIVDPATQEKIETLSRSFTEAEAAFESDGREIAKPLLPKLYAEFISLNQPDLEAIKAAVQKCIDKGDYDNIPTLTPDQINPLAHWNPEGNLSETQFNDFDQRRKKLSNDIGIMTASGEVRHDLNK